MIKLKQVTDTLVMISPDHFQFNHQTASTNSYQKNSDANTNKALNEFQIMVEKLEAHDIRVITFPSRSDATTPDAVFPNNWFSLNQTSDGKTTLILYPMQAVNRRLERQQILLENSLKKNQIAIHQVIDLSHYENAEKALEGTGSLVLDRQNKMAFASISPRTDVDVLADFCHQLGYKAVTFSSYDQGKKLIYHTNVMMSIGENFAVICDECIHDENERVNVISHLRSANKEIISITEQQVSRMAGNILQVKSVNQQSKIILSRTAYEVFTETQKRKLSEFGELVIVEIPVIEEIGGGSARCMMAEVFY
jgi:hypothetical protein